ncbi:MAG: hypothetical protein WD070_08485, partial [Pirellulaceae bacterium]
MMHDGQPLEVSSRQEERRVGVVLLSFLIVLFATAFFVNEVDWQASTYENYAVSPDEAEELVAVGKNSRKVAYVTIGLV